MAKEPLKSVPASEVPEVARFISVQQEVEGFRQANPEFFKVFDELADRYNATLEQAAVAVRARGVSCGPFTLTGKPSIVWDADTLCVEMGVDFFKAHGGTITNKPIYDVDKERIEAAYIAGEIPDEVVSQVRKVQYRYSKPSKIEVP